MARIIFFLGKGGVGKSTVSSLASMALAAEKANTLLISLDPAHNLTDIFERKFSPRPKKVSSCLTVIEIDERAQLKKYLRSMENRITRAYRYHSAFNLSSYFSIVRHSPGIEEYALLHAFMDVYRRHNGVDVILVDLPPTALALKFLRLPSLSLLWLEKLLELRKTIIEKKEIIHRIKIGSRTIEGDKILRGIEKSLNEYRYTNEILTSGTITSCYIIANQDILSASESSRIAEEGTGIGLHLKGIVMNKSLPDLSGSTFKKGPKTQVYHFLPSANEPLVGMEALSRYLNQERGNSLFTELIETVLHHRHC